MENENSKVKRYRVTQSLRLPSASLKFFYYGSFVLMAGAVLTVAICLIASIRGTVMGTGVVAGFFGLIWFIAVNLINENSFGLTTISFGDQYILFRSGDNSFRLKWDDVVECGIEKTRRAFWTYASDHKLSDGEKKEFPENVDEGVFYFNYYWNTWEEFMKFVPEKFKPELLAKKAELNITDKKAK